MPKVQSKRLVEVLEKEFPNPKLELNFKTPLELLIATILSAQCTDKRVNLVTEKLFRKYKSAKEYAKADQTVLENEIKPTGFYKVKAKNIIACSKRLVEVYEGAVPNKLEDLITLSGVWRKTANVLLGNYFGVDAVVVDTHVKRVSHRLGLSRSDDPDVIEKDLERYLPKGGWTRISHQLLLHGRYICKARSPLCPQCELKSLCEWYKGNETRD